eukprot:TRINITY_DN2822_c0_g1_i4.p1 TRINITY_DN2822_c0_g1~~TRINITY_DN2822_c0_g1_i4.p1  ORF type:complete len:5400 (+),score=2320.53 TRINITY_DN2822_c0_g1_i4:448-16200(+)
MSLCDNTKIDHLPDEDKKIAKKAKSANFEESFEITMKELGANNGKNTRRLTILDLLKWGRRCNDSKRFPAHASGFLTTDIQFKALKEGLDILVGFVPEPKLRARIASALSEIWDIRFETLSNHIFQDRPKIQDKSDDITGLSGSVEVGRMTLPILHDPDNKEGGYALTSSHSRLMERLAVSIAQNDPILLVGETGIGKTTAIQELAKRCGQQLMVQNLNVQSDSTDLMGGFKPGSIRQLAIPVYDFLSKGWSTMFQFKDPRKKQALRGKIDESFNKQHWGNFCGWCTRVVKFIKTKSTQIADDDFATWSPETREIIAQFLRTFATFKSQVEEEGFIFSFQDGTLVKALREGHWLLLDEINLASAETLQRLAGLLEDEGSITLIEKNEYKQIKRHPNFRVFGAMNPSTDVNKRELPASLRVRFTEFYVDEISNETDLQIVVGAILNEAVSSFTDKIIRFYRKALEYSRTLRDGAGENPRYSLRTLSRCLQFINHLILDRGYGRYIRLAIWESVNMNFITQLDDDSAKKMQFSFEEIFVKKGEDKKTWDKDLKKATPKKLSNSLQKKGDHVVVDRFKVLRGPEAIVDNTIRVESDYDENKEAGGFVLTDGVNKTLSNLARAIIPRKYPILLQGPTSSGKTSIIEYLAGRLGYKSIRINNHEHTDLQEYMGSYVSDDQGRLVFEEGALVQAVRNGYWLILDELNLAPSEVLEALNRLLDDNRELFLPETQETIRPHPNFLLFATQNPPGTYAGRKKLSRAFKNRFLEMFVGDIPPNELVTILSKRTGIAQSAADVMVRTMTALQSQRNQSQIFKGKDGFITTRDLLKWSNRKPGSDPELLASEGYMLLAERLRDETLKAGIKDTMEKVIFSKKGKNKKLIRRAHRKLVNSVDLKELYQYRLEDDNEEDDQNHIIQLLKQYGPENDDLENEETLRKYKELSTEFTWTNSLRRLFSLCGKCLQNKEPFLLVGETGCGKTTVCQIFAKLYSQELTIVNCHQHTETADFLGGLRPCRDESSDKMFDWQDGPLVKAMKEGHMFLLDEISLAEDAVLERLNSVLEPSRTLLLAEKGGKDVESVTGIESFRIMATMNPGGDFGKKELSPALRNRMTEIWVPAITDSNDLKKIISERFAGDLARFTEPLLEFMTWFNMVARNGGRVSGATENTKQTGSDSRTLSLSLRDMLAVVDFMVRTNDNVFDNPWLCFAHSISMVVLDGLGLGTGLSPEDSAKFKANAQTKIINLAEKESRPLLVEALSIKPSDENIFLHQTNDDENEMDESATSQKFGVSPFFVKCGPKRIPDNVSYAMKAPTTSQNLIRVLRALQLKNAILLEGSPGVGKTSLISALAKASGHELVRVNLSEHTDFSDLVGADLPIASNPDEEIEDATSDKPRFAWCDGPLLTAIKEGKWILLDELNLAPQSVLEGLNSCLDHRAQIFIPELNKSFDCPPSFRVFGAQNPLYEGSGRKGLPKSFLNRFSKVFVDTLSAEDLQFIIESLYPSLAGAKGSNAGDDNLIGQLIAFNKDVVEAQNKGTIGRIGGKWEFNLRDIFRVCDAILVGEDCSSGNEVSVLSAVDLIYTQRLRSQSDRENLDDIFKKRFGQSARDVEVGRQLYLAPGFVQIGNTLLKRNQTSGKEGSAPILHAMLPRLETLMTVIRHKWNALIVGGDATGKTSCIELLAKMTGNSLKTMSLSSDMDSTDLLGGFEQYDVNRYKGLFIEELFNLKTTVSRQLSLNSNGSETREKMIEFISQLELDVHCVRMKLDADKKAEDNPNDQLSISTRISEIERTTKSDETPTDIVFTDGAQKVINKLLANLRSCSEIYSSLLEAEIPMIERLSTSFQKLTKVDPSKKRGVFEWQDSVLVQSLIEGNWLVLDNANMCASNILDRLNSLLEKDGALIMSECGTKDGDIRLIEPHPNFRLFLTCNPLHGEISHAMRNRCIEICFLEQTSNLDESEMNSNKGLNEESLSEMEAFDFLSPLTSQLDENSEASEDPDFPAEGGRKKKGAFSMFSAIHILPRDATVLLNNRGIVGRKIPSLMYAAHERCVCNMETSTVVGHFPTPRHLLNWALYVSHMKWISGIEDGKTIEQILLDGFIHAYEQCGVSPTDLTELFNEALSEEQIKEQAAIASSSIVDDENVPLIFPNNVLEIAMNPSGVSKAGLPWLNAIDSLIEYMIQSTKDGKHSVEGLAMMLNNKGESLDSWSHPEAWNLAVRLFLEHSPISVDESDVQQRIMLMKQRLPFAAEQCSMLELRLQTLLNSPEVQTTQQCLRRLAEFAQINDPLFSTDRSNRFAALSSCIPDASTIVEWLPIRLDCDVELKRQFFNSIQRGLSAHPDAQEVISADLESLNNAQSLLPIVLSAIEKSDDLNGFAEISKAAVSGGVATENQLLAHQLIAYMNGHLSNDQCRFPFLPELSHMFSGLDAVISQFRSIITSQKVSMLESEVIVEKLEALLLSQHTLFEFLKTKSVENYVKDDDSCRSHIVIHWSSLMACLASLSNVCESYSCLSESKELSDLFYKLVMVAKNVQQNLSRRGQHIPEDVTFSMLHELLSSDMKLWYHDMRPLIPHDSRLYGLLIRFKAMLSVLPLHGSRACVKNNWLTLLNEFGVTEDDRMNTGRDDLVTNDELNYNVQQLTNLVHPALHISSRLKLELVQSSALVWFLAHAQDVYGSDHQITVGITKSLEMAYNKILKEIPEKLQEKLSESHNTFIESRNASVSLTVEQGSHIANIEIFAPLNDESLHIAERWTEISLKPMEERELLLKEQELLLSLQSITTSLSKPSSTDDSSSVVLHNLRSLVSLQDSLREMVLRKVDSSLSADLWGVMAYQVLIWFTSYVSGELRKKQANLVDLGSSASSLLKALLTEPLLSFHMQHWDSIGLADSSVLSASLCRLSELKDIETEANQMDGIGITQAKSFKTRSAPSNVFELAMRLMPEVCAGPGQLMLDPLLIQGLDVFKSVPLYAQNLQQKRSSGQVLTVEAIRQKRHQALQFLNILLNQLETRTSENQRVSSAPGVSYAEWNGVFETLEHTMGVFLAESVMGSWKSLFDALRGFMNGQIESISEDLFIGCFNVMNSGEMVILNEVLPILEKLLQLWKATFVNLDSFASLIDTSVEAIHVFGLTWVLMGCFRVALLLPKTEVDPSIIPAVTASRLDGHKNSLTVENDIRQCVGQLHNNSLWSDIVSDIKTKVDILSFEMDALSAQVIDRPTEKVTSGVKQGSYASMVRDFTKFADEKVLKAVLDMIPEISSLKSTIGNVDPKKTLNGDFILNTQHLVEREAVWQDTSLQFIVNTKDKYSAFNDVSVPLLVAILQVKQGLRFALSTAIAPSVSQKSGKFVDNTDTWNGVSSILLHQLPCVSPAMVSPLTSSHQLADFIANKSPLSAILSGDKRAIQNCLKMVVRMMRGFKLGDDKEMNDEITTTFNKILRVVIDIHDREKEDERLAQEEEEMEIDIILEQMSQEQKLEKEMATLLPTYGDQFDDLEEDSGINLFASEDPEAEAKAAIKRQLEHEKATNALKMDKKLIGEVCALHAGLYQPMADVTIQAKHVLDEPKAENDSFVWCIRSLLEDCSNAEPGLMHALSSMPGIDAKILPLWLQCSLQTIKALKGSKTKVEHAPVQKDGIQRTQKRLDINDEMALDSINPDEHPITVKEYCALGNLDIRFNQVSHLDFYNSANVEALTIMLEPVKDMQKQVISRLTSEENPAYAADEMLQLMLRMSDRLLHLPADSPLMMALTGVDQLLQKADEWNVGTPKRFLLNISLLKQLVAQWRVVEAKSWKALLAVKETESCKDALEWWFPMNAKVNWILRHEPTEFERSILVDRKAPWFMVKKDGDTLPQLPEGESKPCLEDLFQELEHYVRSSKVGEFPTRLSLMMSFEGQIRHAISTGEVVCVELASAAADMFHHFVSYYGQFLVKLAFKLKTARDSDAVQNPLKTAKVLQRKLDLQTKESLRLSTLECHKKLVAAVQAYEIHLQQPVFNLLNQWTTDSHHLPTHITEASGNQLISEVMTQLQQLSKSQNLLKEGTLQSVTVLSERLLAVQKPILSESAPNAHHDSISKIVKGLQSKIGKVVLHPENVKYRSFFSETVESLVVQVIKRQKVLAAESSANATSAKRGALTGLLNALEAHGLPASVVIDERMKSSRYLFEVPPLRPNRRHPRSRLSLPNSTLLTSDANKALVHHVNDYHYRIIDQLQQFRIQVSTNRSPDLTDSDMRRFSASVETLFRLISQQRMSINDSMIGYDKILAILNVISNGFKDGLSLDSGSGIILSNQETTVKQLHSLKSNATKLKAKLKGVLGILSTIVEGRTTRDQLQSFLPKNQAKIASETALSDANSETPAATNIMDSLFASNATSQLEERSSQNHNSSGLDMSALAALENFIKRTALGVCDDIVKHISEMVITENDSVLPIIFTSSFNWLSTMTKSIKSIQLKLQNYANEKFEGIRVIADVLKDAGIFVKNSLETEIVNLETSVKDTIDTSKNEEYPSNVEENSLTEKHRNVLTRIRVSLQPLLRMSWDHGVDLNLGEKSEDDEEEEEENMEEDNKPTESDEEKEKRLAMMGNGKILSRAHQKFHSVLKGMALESVMSDISILMDEIHNSNCSRQFLTDMILSLHAPLQQLLIACGHLTSESLVLMKSTCKMEYVLLRLFRILSEKGFCRPQESREAEEGEGGSMEEAGGTGMADGEGSKDVSNEIEDEEQVLGLQGEEEKEKDDNQEDDPLKEDEGLDMDNDFDGALEDVPEDERDDDDQGESEEEQDPDDQMGDLEGDGEVLDEQLWDESDEENEPDKNEKYEENSKTEESNTDEMRGKDDEQLENEENQKDEEEKKTDEDGPEDTETPPQQEEQDNENGDDNQPEEDFDPQAEEEREDYHMDVEAPQPDMEDDDMDLPDELNLDGADEGMDEDEEGEDATGEDDPNELPPEEQMDEPESDMEDGDDKVHEDSDDEENEEEEDVMPEDKIAHGSGTGEENEDENENEDERQQEIEEQQEDEQPEYNTDEQPEAVEGSGDGAAQEKEKPEDAGAEGNESEEEEEENVDDDKEAEEEQMGQQAGGEEGEWQENDAQQPEDAEANQNEVQAQQKEEEPNPFKDFSEMLRHWERNIVELPEEEEKDDTPESDKPAPDTQQEQSEQQDLKFNDSADMDVLAPVIQEDEMKADAVEEGEQQDDDQDENTPDDEQNTPDEFKDENTEQQNDDEEDMDVDDVDALKVGSSNMAGEMEEEEEEAKKEDEEKELEVKNDDEKKNESRVSEN